MPTIEIKLRQLLEKYYKIKKVIKNDINKKQLNMKEYRERIADEILKRKLEGKGAVLIEGTKWCGKTTTAEQIAGSVLYMDEPEKMYQNIVMAELNPKRLLV